MFVPHEPRRSAEARQVDEHHRSRVFEMCIRPAVWTLRTGRLRLDVDVDDGSVEDTQHVDVRKPDEHFAHLGRVGDEARWEAAAGGHAITMSASLLTNADPDSPFRSEGPVVGGRPLADPLVPSCREVRAGVVEDDSDAHLRGARLTCA